MRVTRLRLMNWRNFKTIDIRLSERVLIFGPNASGKSNLLDALRFLRDLTTSPGGLQYAVESRGGIRRVRFLNARSFNSGRACVPELVGRLRPG
jgi:predicted ATPase